jgi:DNA-binding response OmpR family regulator
MRLLLVEDDTRIQEVVRNGLREDKIAVEVASTAEQAMQKIIQPDADFESFLLDIVLPGLSGVDLCRWLRDQGYKEPIIMLTAMGSVEDKVKGLDAGADDYLAKPFQMTELRARIRALFRQRNGYPREVLTVFDLRLDPNTRQVFRGDRELALSAKETALLEYFMKNQGRVVTRAMIANAVWDTETNQYTNVIDVFINHLRKRIHQEGKPDLVHNVRGKGFRLSLPDAEEQLG